MPPPRIPRFSISPLLSHLRNLRNRPSTPKLTRFPYLLRRGISFGARNEPRKEATLGTTILRFGQFFLVVHVFWKYLYSISPVHGISMVPTIPHHHGKKWPPAILISKLHRRGRGLRVGDVIVYVHPITMSHGCKRIIGMPGDWVSVVTPGKRDADIELGAEEEARRQENGEWASVREEMVQVPDGHCWIAGDNLEWSRDSRLFGPVPLALVKGKVLAVCFPWSTMKWLGGRSDSGRLVDAGEETEEEREWVIAK